MSDEYINREEAEKIFVEYSCVKHHVTEMGDTNEANRIMLMFRENAKKLFSLAPSADVAPVVRCKDCEHWDVSKNEYSICCHAYHNMMMVRSDGMGFCSDGERKDDD